MSTMYSGKAVDGQIVVEGADLPEGAEVSVFFSRRAKSS
jgi:hypothetical protein